MDSTAATPSNAAQPAVPLSVSDQQATALLDDTLALLGHGLLAKADGPGSAEIERWAAVLASSDRPGLAKITQELSQLGELLSSPNAASHEVAELLASLSAETIKVAETAPGSYAGPLGSLGALLRKAANSLSR